MALPLGHLPPGGEHVVAHVGAPVGHGPHHRRNGRVGSLGGALRPKRATERFGPMGQEPDFSQRADGRLLLWFGKVGARHSLPRQRWRERGHGFDADCPQVPGKLRSEPG
eukprot:10237056-Lingulodinium_polyedra.AAC.1